MNVRMTLDCSLFHLHNICAGKTMSTEWSELVREMSNQPCITESENADVFQLELRGLTTSPTS